MRARPPVSHASVIVYGTVSHSIDLAYADMRRKFGQIHKEYSPQARKYYCHFTSVIVSVSPPSFHLQH